MRISCAFAMQQPEFHSRDTLKRLWWLHDSFWHAALVKSMGEEAANRLNLEVSEKIFRMLTNTLLREKLIQRPRSIQDLMRIFQVVWQNAFFDGLYVDEPIEFKGQKAIWTGRRCHAYESLQRAGMLEGYECGCKALRTGVMKALRLAPLHRIRENLVHGDGRCVIEVTFSPIIPSPTARSI
jgi:hypothetical protein